MRVALRRRPRLLIRPRLPLPGHEQVGEGSGVARPGVAGVGDAGSDRRARTPGSGVARPEALLRLGPDRRGSPASEVQAAMGHAKASTTLDIYTHLWPKADARIRDAVAGVLDLVRAEQGQNSNSGPLVDPVGEASGAGQ